MLTAVLIMVVSAPLWLALVELAARPRRRRGRPGEEPGESPLLKRPPRPRHPL
jgi:hypothetical protein